MNVPRRSLVLVLFCLPTIAALTGAQSGAAQSALELARKTAVVDGDLAAAITQYQAIVDRYGATERAVAAAAWLGMAEGYEKLGDPQAHVIYTRLVKDYADQTAIAARARTRMGTAAQAAPAPVSRLVTSIPIGSEVYGPVSRSGRFLPYVDWAGNGDLYLQDLSTGVPRRLTDTASSGTSEPQYAENASVSPDDRLASYTWLNREGRYELRLVDLQSDGVPRPRTLAGSADIQWIEPHDWTPDGRRIVVFLRRVDRAGQIALVSVASGELQVLKSVAWRAAGGLYVSPDGRWVAFDAPSSDATAKRDIRALALDGSREVVVAAHPGDDHVLGWSPDGARVIFASDRLGGSSLFTVAFANGSVGTPALAKQEAGALVPHGVTRSGTLYSSEPQVRGTRNLFLATYNFETEETSVPVLVATIPQRQTTYPSHAWSVDGRSLAYLSGSRLIVARASDPAERREVELQMYVPSASALAWAPDSRSIIASGRDFKGRWGLHRVDLANGETTPVAVVTDGMVQTNDDRPYAFLNPEPAPDGRHVYFMRRVRLPGAGPSQFEIVWIKLNLVDGTEIELWRSRLSAPRQLISPDGRYLLTRGPDRVVLIPTDGSPHRELVGALAGLQTAMWAPDSRSVILPHRADANAPPALWRYTLDGQGRPAKPSVLDKQAQLVRVSPDGRTIAYTEAELQERRPTAVFALEHVFDRSAAIVPQTAQPGAR